MNIYTYEDYQLLIRHWLEKQPKKGHGLSLRLAEKLQMSTVMISQVLGGHRDFQPEQALGVAKFMRLTKMETEYFMLLVSRQRSGTTEYREYIQKQIDSIRERATEVKERVSNDITLTEETKARFYSHWSNSAVRLLTDIPTYRTPSAIAKYLSLPQDEVEKVLEFLCDNNLCTRRDGSYQMTVQTTHLDSNSPWIYSRQLQWRQKSIQKMEFQNKDSLFYTGPMALSEKDRVWVRERLVQLIAEIVERVRDSKSEALACLNVDWFKI